VAGQIDTHHQVVGTQVIADLGVPRAGPHPECHQALQVQAVQAHQAAQAQLGQDLQEQTGPPILTQDPEAHPLPGPQASG
jgi:hypothetical protein